MTDKREEVARLLRAGLSTREARDRAGCGNQLVRDVARALKEQPVTPTPTRLTYLHCTPQLQARGGKLDKETVKDYAAAAKAGAKLPPLLAFKVTDRKFPGPALVAGFHRRAGLLEAGVEKWEVEVREGTFAEAWLAGWASNLTHGLRYTPEQKRHAAEQALLLFRKESATQVAKMLDLSVPFVSKIRKELEAAGKVERLKEVITSDGASHPVSIKSGSEESLTVNDSSDGDTNDEPTPEEVAGHIPGPGEPGPSVPAGEVSGEPADDKTGPGTVEVDFGGAGRSKRLADSLVRQVKKLRAGISCLLGSLHGEAVRNVFTSHTVTELYKTGETVDLGSYGGVITVGPPEWSCTALDELGGQLAAASLVLDRIDHTPPDRGEPAAELPWDQLETAEDIPL